MCEKIGGGHVGIGLSSYSKMKKLNKVMAFGKAFSREENSIITVTLWRSSFWMRCPFALTFLHFAFFFFFFSWFGYKSILKSNHLYFLKSISNAKSWF